jgi:lysophospholipase L1-like esterase
LPEVVPPTTPSPAEERAPSRLRDALKGLGLSIVSTAIFFLCIETTLRIADLAPTNALAYPDAETWAAQPGPFEPGQDFVDRFRPHLAHRVHINSLGFRGAEFDAAKGAGAYRIICVGDSYTFGDYVNDDETFPALLEKRLRRDAGRNIDVINAGVNGYSITDESGFMEEKGFSLAPDSVVVAFVLNDLADLTRQISSRENQREEAARMSASRLTPLKRALRRTATYNLLFMLKAWTVGRLHIDPTMQEVPIRHLLSPPYDEKTEALFTRYRAALADLAESCRRHGARLTLVLFPFYEQVVEGASASAQERMAKMGADLGVPVVDLLPAFRRAGSRASKLFLMPLDHHPSARGYRVAAAEIASTLALQAREGSAAAGAP